MKTVKSAANPIYSINDSNLTRFFTSLTSCRIPNPSPSQSQRLSYTRTLSTVVSLFHSFLSSSTYCFPSPPYFAFISLFPVYQTLFSSSLAASKKLKALWVWWFQLRYQIKIFLSPLSFKCRWDPSPALFS